MRPCHKGVLVGSADARVYRRSLGCSATKLRSRPHYSIEHFLSSGRPIHEAIKLLDFAHSRPTMNSIGSRRFAPVRLFADFVIGEERCASTPQSANKLLLRNWNCAICLTVSSIKAFSSVPPICCCLEKLIWLPRKNALASARLRRPTDGRSMPKKRAWSVAASRSRATRRQLKLRLGCSGNSDVEMP